MLFDTFAFAMLDGQVAAVFNSPFVVPVAGCAMIGSIVVAGIWSGVRTREIKSHERLARIAQGLPVEPDWEEATVKMAVAATSQGAAAFPRNDGSKARRAGVVLVSIGLGLLAFFFALAVIVQVREVLAGGVAGILPLAIGIGFLVDARIKKAEFERYMERGQAAGYAPAGFGAVPSVTDAPVPPPPPVGMSTAQASDWRPLH